MERYTLQEREAIVSIYFTNNRSVVLAQREYRRRFAKRVAPTGQTFRRLAARFEQTGTTKDLARCGRPRTGCSVANIAAVAADLAENKDTSTRRRAAQLGITRRTLQRILAKVVKADAQSNENSEKEGKLDTLSKATRKVDSGSNDSDSSSKNASDSNPKTKIRLPKARRHTLQIVRTPGLKQALVGQLEK